MRTGTRRSPRRAKVTEVDDDAWSELLDHVARGSTEVIIKTPASGRAVMVSETYLESLRQPGADGGAAPLPTPLSPREHEVLSLAAEGLTGVVIAGRLGLAVNTVAQHMVSARRKLGARTTRAAVELARQAGELD